MITGHGDIAKVLPDREDLLFFASGVSNSQEKREEEYQREKDLLFSQDDSRRIVYFSSLAVFYSTTRYAKHKREMEQLVKKWFTEYTIIRIGNITWGDNPNTIINFFRNKIKSGAKIEIYNTERYILSKEDFLHWIKLIPDWNCEINIPGKRMKVIDIVKKYGYT